MSQPNVSRTVAALEARLGVTLLLRNTRRIALTEAGSVLLERARKLLADALEVEEAARGAGELRGFLRVAATNAFAERELVPLLPDFLAAHPKMKVELLTSDAVADLVADRVDVAFRLGRISGAAFTARRLRHDRRQTVASAAYLQRRGKPEAPRDLANHDCLSGPGATGPAAWTYRHKGAQVSVDVVARVHVATSSLLVACAVRGLGITIVAHDMVREELASGALVPVLTEYVLEPLELHAVFPAGKRPNAKARAFVDFVASRLPAFD